MLALRLSSAMIGPDVVEPANGVRLADVFVTLVKVPALKSVSGSSAPADKLTAATAGI